MLIFIFSFFHTPFALAGKPAPTLATQLTELVTQGQAVDAELAGITLTAENSCTELGSVNTSVRDWLAAIETVYAGITAALSIDSVSLTSLDDLSNLALSVAGRAESLSGDLNSIAAVAELVEYDASLAAMLRLSDDIGTMANRIGEMADRILVMADNIGLMADRMLITQQLQSSNVVLTQNSILATQQNMITLSDTVDTAAYNSTLTSLLTQANALSVTMSGVTLTETTMDTDLARVETDVTLYLNQVVDLYTRAARDSAIASQYTDGDTLLWAGDLSNIHKALAHSLETYANTINGLAPLTSTPVLADATASMLRLSRDIGIMSDRITEMVDRIIVMADNIGIMAGRIVETQNIQQTNIELTQASLLTATGVTVNVISAYGL